MIATIIELFIKSAFPRRKFVLGLPRSLRLYYAPRRHASVVAHASACRSTPLLGRLELAATDADGRLSFHPACTKVYVDVGASNYGGYVMACVCGLPHDVRVLLSATDRRGASLIARGVGGRRLGNTNRAAARPLHPGERCGLSNEDGEAANGVADGCSSLLPPHALPTSAVCRNQPHQRHVNGSCTDVEAVRHCQR